MEPPSPFPVNELTPAAQGSKKWEMSTQSLIHSAGWSFSPAPPSILAGGRGHLRLAKPFPGGVDKR